MTSSQLDLLVSPGWLAEHLQDPDLVVLDASWYLPAMNRSGAAEYAQAHIPGAVFFDIDANSDHSTPLPHMLPSEAQFAEALGRLGIRSDMHAVVYDGAGLFSAARVWWMLRIFGMAKVSLLDGGLPAWKAAGLPTQSGPVSRPQAVFVAQLERTAVADVETVQSALAAGTHQVLDARSLDRFHGLAPEPRAGLRGGHIPGSRSLPMTDLLSDGRLKDPAALAQAFSAAGVDAGKPIITSCGSGVSAAVITLAQVRLGRDPGKLYDGSWTEWGGRADLPVETA